MTIKIIVKFKILSIPMYESHGYNNNLNTCKLNEVK